MNVAKTAAARHALSLVEDGLKLGLGTGSTSALFVQMLADHVNSRGIKIVAVATSQRTQQLAEQCGIAISELDQVGQLDLTIDGADEIDHHLNLIKGGGGALLRERIVACSSAVMVAIADDSKLVDCLGQFELPVEIVRFGAMTTLDRIREYLADSGFGQVEGTVRMDGDQPFLSDEGNLVTDWPLGRISQPDQVNSSLKGLTGVVETGLFTHICGSAILGHDDDTTTVLAAPGTTTASEARSAGGPI